MERSNGGGRGRLGGGRGFGLPGLGRMFGVGMPGMPGEDILDQIMGRALGGLGCEELGRKTHSEIALEAEVIGKNSEIQSLRGVINTFAVEVKDLDEQIATLEKEVEDLSENRCELAGKVKDGEEQITMQANMISRLTAELEARNEQAYGHVEEIGRLSQKTLDIRDLAAALSPKATKKDMMEVIGKILEIVNKVDEETVPEGA